MINEKLTEYFFNSIKHNWNLPAFRDYGKEGEIKFSDVAKHIHKTHSTFKRMGIYKGEKIALCGVNSTNWALTYLSVVSYGAVIVPILVDFSKEDITSILKDSGSEYLFIDKNIYDKLGDDISSSLKMTFNLEDFSIIQLKKEDFSNVELGENIFNSEDLTKFNKDDFKLNILDNDTLATIIYTSGTTGFSKGVMLNHNALSANVRFGLNNMPINAGDNMISFLPLAHVFGCLFDFLFPFSKGVCINMLGSIPSPNILLKAFAELKPSLILMVPLLIEKIYLKKLLPTISKPIIKKGLNTPIIDKILKKKICSKLTESFGGNFKEVIIGGSALNSEVEAFLMDIGFKFTVGYGMTECAPLISYSPYDKHIARSCGCLIDTLEIKIDAEKEGEVGEIMVKGENVMLGYYKNPKATTEVLSRDGWLRTGDLGVLGENNRIFIKGRSKNMLLSPNGQNIYPEELESKLNTMPYILESLIVQRDNKLHALLFLDEERIKEEKLTEEQIKEKLEINREEANKIFPDFARITGYTIQKEEFIKNATKKIKRFLYK